MARGTAALPYYLALAVLFATIASIRCEDNTAAAAPAVAQNTASADEALPASWSAAIRKMVARLAQNPSEEMYARIARQVVSLKPYIDDVFKNESEEKKDRFIEAVMDDVVKTMEKKSRVPLKFRLSNVVIGRMVDEFGRVPTKRPSKAVQDQLKSFANELTAICKSDVKCKKML